MLLSLKLLRMTLNLKHGRKKWKLKTKYIETWKAKTQKDKSLVFQKKVENKDLYKHY